MRKGNIKAFVRDAFDYTKKLQECSLVYSTNRYLLEFIAYGFVQYDNVEKFIDNIDDWLLMVSHTYGEVGFDHEAKQLKATIDLVDNLVIIDENLKEALEYVINVQKEYGLLISYQSKKIGDGKTTLCHFFEAIEKQYPVVQDRFKGLGSSGADATTEVIMDPRTRRIMQVTANDIQTEYVLATLVGKSKENILDRKELLMNFKFDMSMIDN